MSPHQAPTLLLGLQGHPWSPSGTNLPPPAEMRTSNSYWVRGEELGCSTACQPPAGTGVVSNVPRERAASHSPPKGTAERLGVSEWPPTALSLSPGMPPTLQSYAPALPVGGTRSSNFTLMCTSTPSSRATFSRISCSCRIPGRGGRPSGLHP